MSAGAIIFRRPVRLEGVKANNSFVVWNKSYGAISAEEVRNSFGAFGDLSKCDDLHEQLQEVLGLPPAVFIQYKMYDPHRKLSILKANDKYHVEAYDLKKIVKPVLPPKEDGFAGQFDTDRRTVFIGNLPDTTTEDDIRKLVRNIGPVVRVQIVKKFHESSELISFVYP
jgi:hypothetical protein